MRKDRRQLVHEKTQLNQDGVLQNLHLAIHPSSRLLNVETDFSRTIQVTSPRKKTKHFNFL